MAEVLPIVEQITANVISTLAGVTVARGFQQSLKVARAKPKGTPAGTNLAIVVELDPESNSEPSEMALRWWQPYAVLLLVFEPENSTYPTRKRLQLMAADAAKALMVDYQRGGLACDTQIRGGQWMDNAADFDAADGMLFIFAVDYSHDVNDPYILRS